MTDISQHHKSAYQKVLRLAWTLGHRVAGGAFVLWASATFTFLLQKALPGDQATIIINQAAGNFTDPTIKEIAAANAKYGFDLPVYTQYAQYIGRMLRGDLGSSYQLHRPVSEIIAGQLEPTIVLTFSSLVVAWIIAVVITVTCAGRDNVWSRFATGAQIIMAAFPPYWIGAILLVVFSITLHIFPVEGDTGLAGLVLPTLTLAIPLAGFLGQVMQEEFKRVLSQPFVITARARGMSDLGVRTRHVLRHSVLPAITLSGWAVGSLFSGAVVVDTVFARPGLGGVLVSATSGRDIPLVTGIIVVSAFVYVIANLIVDLIYSLIDRRLLST